MDIGLLNELSVRRGEDSAQVFRGIRARGELSQLASKRLVILVHGFAVPAAEARSTYQDFIGALVKTDDRLAATTFCAFWGFHWPGDHDGPRFLRGATSKGTFSIRIELAGRAGRLLASLLSRLLPDQEIYFVAHSLGCRVVMETLYEIADWRGPWPGATVKGAFLMAAAVPSLFCADEPTGGDPEGVPHFFHKRPWEPTEWVFYSAKDWILNKPFRGGEWLHGEGGGEAVGLQGLPLKRWEHPVETTLKHKDYWPDKEKVILKQMPEMLGLPPRRQRADRSIGHERPGHRLLPLRPWRRRSLGATLDGEWEVLIREDGATTDALSRLLLR